MDDAERADGECTVHYRMALRRMRHEASCRPSTVCCIDCGEPIPAERREAMEAMEMTCDRCVFCKQLSEKGSG